MAIALSESYDNASLSDKFYKEMRVLIKRVPTKGTLDNQNLFIVNHATKYCEGNEEYANQYYSRCNHSFEIALEFFTAVFCNLAFGENADKYKWNPAGKVDIKEISEFHNHMASMVNAVKLLNALHVFYDKYREYAEIAGRPDCPTSMSKDRDDYFYRKWEVIYKLMNDVFIEKKYHLAFPRQIEIMSEVCDIHIAGYNRVTYIRKNYHWIITKSIRTTVLNCVWLVLLTVACIIYVSY